MNSKANAEPPKEQTPTPDALSESQRIYIETLERELHAAQAREESLRRQVEELNERVETALHRAFRLGQTYWQQADSEYTSHHRKADETRAKFNELVASFAAIDTARGGAG